MRRSTFYLLSSLALFICFITLTSGYQIAETKLNSLNLPKQELIERSKREVETKHEIEDVSNEDFPIPAGQGSAEEPGFWERIVKMAIKLFNKFVEWLNSS